MSNVEKFPRPRTYRIPKKYLEMLDYAEFVIPDKPIPGILLIDARMLNKLQDLLADQALGKQFQVLLVPTM